MKVKFKPETIDALQNDGTEERVANIEAWVKQNDGETWRNPDPIYAENIVIHRHDGMLYLAKPGDWIVKADEGQFFVMRNDDFTAVYKAANPAW